MVLGHGFAPLWTVKLGRFSGPIRGYTGGAGNRIGRIVSFGCRLLVGLEL